MIVDVAKGLSVMAAGGVAAVPTVPAYYRSLPREISNKLLEMSQAGASEEEIFDVQRGYNGMRDDMLFADLTKGGVSSGIGSSMVNKIEPMVVIIIMELRS